MARLAGDGLDDHRALLYFGHFLFEEALDEPGRRARDEHLRIPAAASYTLDEHLDAVARFVSLTGDLILREHEPLDLPLAELDVDVLHVDLADEPAHEFALFIGKFAERVVALRLVDLLQNDLLCGLRGDAREIFGDELLGKDVACLGRLFDLERLFEGDLPFLRLFAVDDDVRQEEPQRSLFLVRAHFDIARLALELLFIGRGERRRERIEEHLFADALFPFQIGKRRKEIFIDHNLLLPK